MWNMCCFSQDTSAGERRFSPPEGDKHRVMSDSLSLFWDMHTTLQCFLISKLICYKTNEGQTVASLRSHQKLLSLNLQY